MEQLGKLAAETAEVLIDGTLLYIFVIVLTSEFGFDLDRWRRLMCRRAIQRLGALRLAWTKSGYAPKETEETE
jgi:hypothetical protein